jgi:hypothetical protein
MPVGEERSNSDGHLRGGWTSSEMLEFISSGRVEIEWMAVREAQVLIPQTVTVLIDPPDLQYKINGNTGSKLSGPPAGRFRPSFAVGKFRVIEISTRIRLFLMH